MAVTFTLVSATENQLKYRVDATAGGSADLTAIVMAAGAVPGSKLAAIVSASYASQAAAQAVVFGETMQLGLDVQAAAPAGKSFGVDANVTATALKLTVTSEGIASAYLTIRYIHTFVR